ncbi:PTS system lactose-specific transporter subunit IIBC [Streptococcus pneumoniae]|nr:PTS system lactose-specific transporter subunit IIBC [Streptococcus pneumoniae]CVV43004.1 PTS system lactose-specific transporter subunit IIBC [Streptococcus pneumoniae]CWC69778.1 PTS system lactose-specific transporter subunit IIBC [Streptococcus pneumoniae]CWK51681.1 PTS system lactose-specific transporter subunit IIBC [Streptococcus pneumoniae]VNG35522.1 PTS system lactose-specific transporter subunit IIBC [Streptococcus pneumoniae]
MSLDLTTAINFIHFYSFMQHSEKAVSYMEVVLFSYCLNTRYLLQVVDVASSNDIILEEETSEIMPGELDEIKSKELKVLVLCAGSGTSAQLANAINEGAQLAEVRVIANSGAYGAHYDIMGVYDLIILAPQVRSYYREMKVDAERLGIQIVATRGMEYIHLTKSPSKALQFVLEHYQAV